MICLLTFFITVVFFSFFSSFHIFNSAQRAIHRFSSIFFYIFFLYCPCFFSTFFFCCSFTVCFYSENFWAAWKYNDKNNWRPLFFLSNKFNFWSLFFFCFSIFKVSISFLFSNYKTFILTTNFLLSLNIAWI